jgi:hypothetical protein
MSSITRKRTTWVVICVLLCLLLTTSVVSSAFSRSVVISSYGAIDIHEITAQSGSPADLQVAVNMMNVAGGGTVHIPAGTWIWNSFTKSAPNNSNCTVLSYGGVDIIGAGIWQTILMQTANPFVSGSSSPAMLTVDGRNGKPTRITGISFQGYNGADTNESTGSVGITMVGVTDYRIDHCYFESFTTCGVSATKSSGNYVNRGLIDHCSFDNSYKANPGTWSWGYGVIVSDMDYSQWSDIDVLLGKYAGANDIVYIEDCAFNRMRHAVANSQNGYYVLRHSTITNEVPLNYGSIDVHGFNAGRGCEAYENTVIATAGYPAAQAVWLRGGTSTIFDNTFVNCSYGVQIYWEPASSPPYPNTNPITNSFR